MDNIYRVFFHIKFSSRPYQLLISIYVVAMGKLIDLISGGVERIAEASANKSGRGNGGHSVGK